MEEEEQVYGVDEEGYLLDEEGNYIYNEYDERVQLSEEDFNELMKQQNGWCLDFDYSTTLFVININ